MRPRRSGRLDGAELVEVVGQRERLETLDPVGHAIAEGIERQTKLTGLDVPPGSELAPRGDRERVQVGAR